MKEDFEKELGKLMDKYSILKNDDIKNTLVNNLHKYTNYKEEYVVLDMYNTLTPDMEKILDDSLDEIEHEDKGTQTPRPINQNRGTYTNRIDDTRENILDNLRDDIDRTFRDISDGIDEIGSFIGQWFDDLFEDEVVD